MKKLIYILSGIIALSVAFVSCNDEETYADQKEREAKQIRKWISDHDIDVISMSDFLKDTITNNPETGPDSTRNEYVLFSDNGVYMQIVRRGEGRLIESDEMRDYNARYIERYVGTGDSMTANIYQSEPDVFYVKRNGGNYTASFKSGIMKSVYGNSVPNAWIMTMPFIKPLYDRLVSLTGIKPNIHIQPPGTIQRSTGKAKHVNDKRDFSNWH